MAASKPPSTAATVPKGTGSRGAMTSAPWGCGHLPRFVVRLNGPVELSAADLVPGLPVAPRPTSGLFGWAGTGDEDVDEPFGALLPVRAGGHVGDADQRPQQVDRIEVLADIAALNRALHQCANRFPDPGVGSLEYFLWIAQQRVECRGDELLGG